MGSLLRMVLSHYQEMVFIFLQRVLVFVYGFYEIGAYAIGMPTFTVPYKKIGKFLSPEARRLAGIK